MVQLRVTPTRPLEPFHVIGFDPGGTTGWARVVFKPTEHQLSGEEPVSLSDIFMECGEFIGEHHKTLYRFMMKSINEAPIFPEFVTEPFEYRQFARQEGDDIGRTKVNLISCEYIGIMKLAIQAGGSSLYTGFNAGEAKSYVPNMKLEKLGWLQKPVTPKRHMNDALRQVVKYLVVKKLIRHPITTCWKDEN